MAGDGTWTIVARIPNCDINPIHGPAYADASLKRLHGTWGNVCKECFELHGGALGLGAGQELLTEPPTDEARLKPKSHLKTDIEFAAQYLTDELGDGDPSEWLT